MRERGAETGLEGSVGSRRMPQRQHAIQPQAVDGLYDTGLFDLPCNRTQAERVERNGSCRSQKSQVAEVRRQFEIAHRQIALDVLLRDQPYERGFLIAELIDQLEIDRLVAGEDPPVRDFVE